MRLSDLPTPCLILDRGVLARNCRIMADRMASHDVRLRPHLKTSKSAEVAALACFRKRAYMGNSGHHIRLSC